jgi:hypothetical protein
MPEVPWLDEQLVRRTRANYAGLVTMCDRWFGHLIDTLRVTGVLDEALVVVTSDHGHSLWERRGYIGKRGYPSDPESYELPLAGAPPAQASRRDDLRRVCPAPRHFGDVARGSRRDTAGSARRQIVPRHRIWRGGTDPRSCHRRLGIGDDG